MHSHTKSAGIAKAVVSPSFVTVKVSTDLWDNSVMVKHFRTEIYTSASVRFLFAAIPFPVMTFLRKKIEKKGDLCYYLA